MTFVIEAVSISIWTILVQVLIVTEHTYMHMEYLTGVEKQEEQGEKKNTF